MHTHKPHISKSKSVSTACNRYTGQAARGTRPQIMASKLFHPPPAIWDKGSGQGQLRPHEPCQPMSPVGAGHIL